VRAALKAEFPGNEVVYDLFDQFLKHTTYDRSFSQFLIRRSRQGNALWALRRLAVLMLHHQISLLEESDVGEFDFVLTTLGIKESGGPISESVLKEGYSTNELPGFISEFKRRLARHVRAAGLMDIEKTPAAAVKEFIHLSRHECRLLLARYLWTPEEVVERILMQVRLSRAARDPRPMRHPFFEREAERVLSSLPDFESQILKRLLRMSTIFWVSEYTSSRINVLVEYPLSTVVLVIKLPGSDIEIELKRAGTPEMNPLDVCYSRNGDPVPVTHRLHAGSMGEYLRWDASASAILSHIYRLIHGTEAPISRTVSVSTIYSIPTTVGEQHILRYFTDPRVFGGGFNKMRAAMAESIAAFKRERDWTPPNGDGDLGLTAQFLSIVAPGQAVLAGTTSFRLDRLAKYLSPTGPRDYFQEGLKTEFTDLDAKLFLDDILYEVLGTYTPPCLVYRDAEQYVRAAFDLISNRELADANYLSMLRDIGTFWGTLMGLGSFTRGESFVARNVGLRTVWENGRSRARIIFMDHDDLDIVGAGVTEFYPRAVLPAMSDDEIHIFGGLSCGEAIKGEIGFLDDIYRINSAIKRQGKLEILQAIDSSYKKTTRELAENKKVRACFHEAFIERLNDWRLVVSRYLAAGKDGSSLQAWRSETKDFLAKRGHNDHMIYDYFCAIDTSDDFLNRYSFLF